ncbi:hypothetical protein O3P69_003065 [Scylla paramamosain]|uniref:Uncharacterized protein n=1 Tax=Scylla paramamosain TaxID=85552 RepID=A0AAW0UIY3_SCYPA
MSPGYLSTTRRPNARAFNGRVRRRHGRRKQGSPGPASSNRPYSPDLAPCDFFLFPKLKEVMKGTRFDDADDIKKAVTTELRSIPQESFQQCMQAWQRRMDKCMRCQGDYFEGDNL